MPVPLPRKVIHTSYCTHLLFKPILQTGLGMGMGMNGTARSRNQPIHILLYIYIYIHIAIYIYIYIYVTYVYNICICVSCAEGRQISNLRKGDPELSRLSTIYHDLSLFVTICHQSLFISLCLYLILFPERVVSVMRSSLGNFTS